MMIIDYLKYIKESRANDEMSVYAMLKDYAYDIWVYLCLADDDVINIPVGNVRIKWDDGIVMKFDEEKLNDLLYNYFIENGIPEDDIYMDRYCYVDNKYYKKILCNVWYDKNNDKLVGFDDIPTNREEGVPYTTSDICYRIMSCVDYVGISFDFLNDDENDYLHEYQENTEGNYKSYDDALSYIMEEISDYYITDDDMWNYYLGYEIMDNTEENLQMLIDKYKLDKDNEDDVRVDKDDTTLFYNENALPLLVSTDCWFDDCIEEYDIQALAETILYYTKENKKQYKDLSSDLEIRYKE